MAPATVNKALERMTAGLAQEITGGQYNRLFAYAEALRRLAGGT